VTPVYRCHTPVYHSHSAKPQKAWSYLNVTGAVKLRDTVHPVAADTIQMVETLLQAPSAAAVATGYWGGRRLHLHSPCSTSKTAAEPCSIEVQCNCMLLADQRVANAVIATESVSGHV
jgi:hypothetical protein